MRITRTKSTLLLALCVPPVLIVAGMAEISSTGLSAPPPPWIASSRYARKANPIESTPASIAAGARLYTAQCLSCHGKSGTGNGVRAAELDPRPQDLTNPNYWLQSDGELYYKTTKGRTPMPAFAKLLSDEERWHTINYIRTFAPKPTVLGPRFDVGSTPRAALADTLAAAMHLADAAANDDTGQIDNAIGDLAGACDALKGIALTDQDKAIGRLWKNAASRLSSQAKALGSASDQQARSIALSRLSGVLADTLRQFGGVQSGRVYQFATPAPDGLEGVWTWIQSDATPRSPFASTGSKQPTVVAVFGPQTRTAD